MRIVVALGGNALLKRGEPMTAEVQRRNVKIAAEAIAPVARDHQVLISHGNGPQVGLLALQGAAYKAEEAYPLDGQVASLVRKVTWLLHPTHRELPGFLQQLRETLNQQAGDTKVQFGFVFEDRVASIAEASNALSWKLNAPAFQKLRAHPAVAGVQIETKPVELKEERRWKKRA